MKRLVRFLVLAGLALHGPSSFGQAIIESSNGVNSIALGVDLNGNLNVANGTDSVSAQNASNVGISFFLPSGNYGGVDYNAGYYDATSPGCLCEGWGVSANNTHSGYANAASGVSNIVNDTFLSSGTNITTRSHLGSLSGLSVEHSYGEALAGQLFEGKVKISNTTGSTLSDVKYVRSMDWDVPFTEFAEYVTIQGTGTTSLLEASHNDGFITSDPLNFGTGRSPGGSFNTDFEDLGPADHGAAFLFNFGTLNPGEAAEFSIFYGAAPTEAAMLTALGTVGVELFSLGQSGTTSTSTTIGDPVTFAFGFKGVGGTIILPPPPPPPGPGVVPEPTSFALWATALVCSAPLRVRRRRA